MAELIVALCEAIVGLVTVFFEALAVILEGLLYVLAASITIVAYAFSPAFRARKRKEWAEKPRRKYLDLGISTACLISIIGLVVWLALPSPEPAGTTVRRVHFENGMSQDDVRLKIETASATNDVTFAIKKGGTSKILETHSLEDLKKAIRENITVVQPANKTQETNLGNAGQPIRSETNQQPPAPELRR